MPERIRLRKNSTESPLKNRQPRIHTRLRIPQIRKQIRRKHNQHPKKTQKTRGLQPVTSYHPATTETHHGKQQPGIEKTFRRQKKKPRTTNTENSSAPPKLQTQPIELPPKGTTRPGLERPPASKFS
ncbi:hypothetical protein Ancab_026199 [Ancistrocladus abbreviatus]